MFAVHRSIVAERTRLLEKFDFDRVRASTARSYFRATVQTVIQQLRRFRDTKLFRNGGIVSTNRNYTRYQRGITRVSFSERLDKIIAYARSNITVITNAYGNSYSVFIFRRIKINTAVLPFVALAIGARVLSRTEQRKRSRTVFPVSCLSFYNN